MYYTHVHIKLVNIVNLFVLFDRGYNDFHVSISIPITFRWYHSLFCQLHQEDV